MAWLQSIGAGGMSKLAATGIGSATSYVVNGVMGDGNCECED